MIWPSVEQIRATCTQEIKYPESANAVIGLWMKLGYTTYKHKAATKNDANNFPP